MIHRHRLYLTQTLIFIFLIIAPLEPALAVELNGSVTKVTKTEVTIKVVGSLLPQFDDIVHIQESIPGLGLIPVQGEWKVTTVTSVSVTAIASGDASTPQIGQTVIIESNNPTPASSLSQDSETLYQQGMNYFNGENGKDQNLTKAVELFHDAASLGNITAQAKLGYMYDRGEGVIADPKESFKWSRKAAMQGHKSAQFNVGLLLSIGKGVEEDKTEAAKWFRKAADQNDLDAQYRLGEAYYKGDGVMQNYSQAASWHTKAAQGGYLSSQKRLGSLYEDGEGVPQDFSKAQYWFKKAADQNDGRAMELLGFLFSNSENPEKDPAQAFFWFKKAAEQDMVISQWALGTFYEYGTGTTKDISKAIFWYQKSSDQGEEDATEALARLTGTPSSAPNSTGGATEVAMGQIPEDARQIVNQIQSASGSTQQRGAKLLYRSPYKSDPAVLEVVHQELLKGYDINTGDKYHVDAMAWLCTILGTAGPGSYRYKATLEKLSKTAESRKIRKYAHKYAALASDQGDEEATVALAYRTGNPSTAQYSTGGTTEVAMGQIPEGARQFVSQIQSANGSTQQRGAKLLYRSAYKSDPAVLEAVHQELLNGYEINVGDKYHVDAMAWLCTILGTAGSGDHRYKATLDKISQTAESRKIRKYAKKYAAGFH